MKKVEVMNDMTFMEMIRTGDFKYEIVALLEDVVELNQHVDYPNMSLRKLNQILKNGDMFIDDATSHKDIEYNDMSKAMLKHVLYTDSSVTTNDVDLKYYEVPRRYIIGYLIHYKGCDYILNRATMRDYDKMKFLTDYIMQKENDSLFNLIDLDTLPYMMIYVHEDDTFNPYNTVTGIIDVKDLFEIKEVVDFDNTTHCLRISKTNRMKQYHVYQLITSYSFKNVTMPYDYEDEFTLPQLQIDSGVEMTSDNAFIRQISEVANPYYIFFGLNAYDELLDITTLKDVRDKYDSERIGSKERVIIRRSIEKRSGCIDNDLTIKGHYIDIFAWLDSDDFKQLIRQDLLTQVTIHNSRMFEMLEVTIRYMAHYPSSLDYNFNTNDYVTISYNHGMVVFNDKFVPLNQINLRLLKSLMADRGMIRDEEQDIPSYKFGKNQKDRIEHKLFRAYLELLDNKDVTSLHETRVLAQEKIKAE